MILSCLHHVVQRTIEVVFGFEEIDERMCGQANNIHDMLLIALAIL